MIYNTLTEAILRDCLKDIQNKIFQGRCVKYNQRYDLLTAIDKALTQYEVMKCQKN